MLDFAGKNFTWLSKLHSKNSEEHFGKNFEKSLKIQTFQDFRRKFFGLSAKHFRQLWQNVILRVQEHFGVIFLRNVITFTRNWKVTGEKRPQWFCFRNIHSKIINADNKCIFESMIPNKIEILKTTRTAVKDPFLRKKWIRKGCATLFDFKNSYDKRTLQEAVAYFQFTKWHLS